MARLFALLAVLTAGCAFAQEIPTETERLVETARLWITVKYFHPYLAYRDIDWDKALVATLPRVREAKSETDYSAAIALLLDALHDPSSYVLPAAPQETTLDSFPPIANQPVVFDLRASNGLAKYLDSAAAAAQFSGVELDAPAQQSWTHTAFDSAFLTKAGRHFTAAPPPDSVFLLGENCELPAVAAALVTAGKAHVLTESGHYQIAGTDTITVPFTGFRAIVRLSESVLPVPVQLIAHDAIDSAAQRLLGKPAAIDPPVALPRVPIIKSAGKIDNGPYPSVENRILAAFKVWGTIHYFFAYKDLMDEDWDDVFTSFLPKFIAARDALEYNLTLTDMLTHLADSHTAAQSATLTQYFGEATVGLRLRMIEKYPVITAVMDPAATAAGIRPGDIVKRVDGESIVERFNRLVQYIPASTAQRSGFDTAQALLGGPQGSQATLSIEGANGEAQPVTLQRDVKYQAEFGQRSGEAIQILGSHIGYLDLDRLDPTQVDSALERLRDTKALILDLRGHAPAAVAIAARLAVQRDVPAAIVTTPLALRPDIVTEGTATESASSFEVQTLSGSGGSKYTGKTVALVDERTMQDSEYAGLLLEVANKTEFVGSPTAGADSEIASFALPGGVTVTYSGRDIRHANGGKLQRLGIQPTVNAPATMKGIRAQKDEALEAALARLSH